MLAAGLYLSGRRLGKVFLSVLIISEGRLKLLISGFLPETALPENLYWTYPTHTYSVLPINIVGSHLKYEQLVKDI